MGCFELELHRQGRCASSDVICSAKYRQNSRRRTMEVSHGWLALAASHAIGHDCSQESQESEAVASPGFGQQDDMDDSASSACLKAWWASQLTMLGESVLQDLGHPATLRSG